MWENLKQRIDDLQKKITARQSEIKEIEQDIAKLKQELTSFQKRYDRIVKPIADKIEALHKAINDLKEAQLREGIDFNSQWPDDHRRNDHADTELPPLTRERLPTADKRGESRHSRLKSLFRNLARRFHPDLAPNEDDRGRRNHIMSQINTAYQDGDLESLEALAEAAPEDEREMLDEMLPMAIMRIRKLQRQYDELEGILMNLQITRHDLKYGHLMELKLQEALRRNRGPRDAFLKEVAADLEAEYHGLQQELRTLRQKMR